MSTYRSVRDLDWTLLIITLLICGLGILQIYSATRDTRWEDAWWKQIIWVAGGLVVMWIVSQIDYHSLLSNAFLFYFLSVIALALVLMVGGSAFGARRWIELPGFKLQISEFVKTVIILLVARYLTELKSDRVEGRDLLKLGGLVAVPTVLVMKQPDLGTALTYLPILGIGVLLAGLRWQYWVAIAIILVLVVPLGWHFVLKDYQKARLVTFLDPGQDPRGSGYQVIQSKIAVGAGGMWGRGVTKGTQTQLRFLPVPHTDFIFSAFAEEHGFVGVVVILGLYFLLLMQIVQNAQMAPDRSGMYVCMGVAALLLFHILVNIGMVVGRMPVTGIPLPLMTYGGSNALSFFLMLGLVNSVRLWRFVS
ncbi:MAG TPA: rod shape-determining protein RodA [Bryobacteraceae bacterium]|nr:rod shape-determining protein RodA [Bryobacteraceae bacterium]HOQ43769.1 rod shape-determining protein RodA [Bryobacteraceae bacterium]HPQ15058.1 rod shape-determining protein RodA [Bryobacteraceae bacterium]HPU71788.1 rod shape-determining protein RodA [Bryobacteraceae bacterium]